MEPLISKGVEPKGALLALLWAALFCFTATLFFFKLGSYQTLTLTEGYVAVPAREMLRTGDWLVPRFGGSPRLEKPPLAYWLVGSLGWLRGEINEFIVRLPAAFASLCLVGLMGLWGTKWYGSRAGLCAGFIQASMTYMISLGRRGMIDVPLSFLTTLTLYLVAGLFDESPSAGGGSAVNPSPKNLSLWIIFFLLGIASLAKPFIGPALVLLSATSFLMIQRRFREIIYLANPVGVITFALLTLAWPYAVSQRVPSFWTVWYLETIGRATGSTRFDEPLWFYPVAIFWMTLPWTPIILLALPESWRRAWPGSNERELFLWIWWLSQVAALSLSTGKRSHYLLQALPALTLIASKKLADLTRPLDGPHRSNLTMPAAAGILLFCAGCAVATGLASAQQWPAFTDAWLSLALILGIGSCVAIWTFTAGRRWLAASAMVLVLLLVGLTVQAWIVPHLDPRRRDREFARRVNAHVPSEEEIIVVGQNRTPLVFYIRHPVIFFMSQRDNTEIKERLVRKGTLYIVAQGVDDKVLQATGHVEILDRVILNSPTVLPPDRELLLARLTSTPK